MIVDDPKKYPGKEVGLVPTRPSPDKHLPPPPPLIPYLTPATPHLTPPAYTHKLPHHHLTDTHTHTTPPPSPETPSLLT